MSEKQVPTERREKTRLDKIADGISAVMILLCVLIFAVMVFSVSYGVLGRYISFIHNPRWTQELAILCMVWICFVAAGYAVKEGLHVRMTILTRLLPKAVARVFNQFASLLLVAINLFWVVYGCELVSMTSRARMPATGWPLSLTYLSVVVGGFYGLAMAIYRLLKGEG